MEAASRAGAPHLVYISVVGAERIPMAGVVDRAVFGYYTAEWAAEQVVESSGCRGPPCAPPSSTT